MYKSRNHIYLYQGYALAAGGTLERDGDRVAIEGVAPAVLSIAGGSSHGPRQSYTYPDRSLFGRKSDFYLRIKSARSEVVGKEHAGGYTTQSRTWLEGFDLAGMVTADAIESDLLSEHEVPGAGREGRISVGESRIIGLKVNKVSVDTKRNPALDEYLTYAELRQYIASAQAAAMREVSLIGAPGDEPEYVCDLRRCDRQDLVRCTIFQSLTPAKTSLKMNGYSVEIPKFGRIFFGELLVTHGVKRLSMIRVDLGCDPAGAVVGGFGVVDGETMP